MSRNVTQRGPKWSPKSKKLALKITKIHHMGSESSSEMSRCQSARSRLSWRDFEPLRAPFWWFMTWKSCFCGGSQKNASFKLARVPSMQVTFCPKCMGPAVHNTATGHLRFADFPSILDLGLRDHLRGLAVQHRSRPGGMRGAIK